MDSGNSGSLQSSSGGDDDFDAACGGGADSSTSSPLAALLRQQGFGGGGGSSLIYGLQELGAPPLSSHWCSTATAPLPPAVGGAASASPQSSLPCHGGLAAAASAPTADHAASATPEAQPAAPAAPARGSRKRPRASRRAPTTVLTTDTSNFRAMVQEFTGIPAPPFAAGATSGARSRLDHLFPSRSSAASSLPQYLLRPFAHKQQLHAYPPPFTSPSTSQPAPASAAIAAPTAAPSATAVAPCDGNPQQLTTAAPSNLLGMQDHGSNYLSFQNTLGAQHDGGEANKYLMFDRGGATPPSPATRMQDPADFLGLAHGVVMSSSEGTHAAHVHQRNGDELSGLVGGCKATYSSARPLVERNGPRPPPGGACTETTTTATAAMRTQGVDSWVCSTSE